VNGFDQKAVERLARPDVWALDLNLRVDGRPFSLERAGIHHPRHARHVAGNAREERRTDSLHDYISGQDVSLDYRAQMEPPVSAAVENRGSSLRAEAC
jgi:hypothetical protein